MKDPISVQRKTMETSVDLSVTIEGTGRANIDTGVGFLDHMLTLWTVHGFFDLSIKATGDLAVDDHHTVEDVAITLGTGLKKALGGLRGIRRYGQAAVPMEEALAMVYLDICSRPYLVFDVRFPSSKIGQFDTELVEEFLRALAVNCGMTLHVRVPYGKNSHHMAEAIFKALGRALDQATAEEPRLKSGVLSSKGSL